MKAMACRPYIGFCHVRKKKGEIMREPLVKRYYRLALLLFLLADLCLIGFWYVKEMDKRIPSHIYLFQNQETMLDIEAPVSCDWQETKEVIKVVSGRETGESRTVSLNKPLAVRASALGSYQAELKWFGVIPYKYIHFDVIEKEKVMPSGKAVGLYIRSKGIMVLGTTKVIGKDGLSHEPAKDILMAGDTIRKIDGAEVNTIDQVVSSLQKGENPHVKLTVKRKGSMIHLKMDKVPCKDGEYKLGVWLREDTEGIGTLSFITKKNEFAALGHGITDIDTGDVIPVDTGKVYPAVIEDIKRGRSGNPGELIGSVVLGQRNCMGVIKSNTFLGITGQIEKEEEGYQESEALPVGLKHEVKKGKAWILCQAGIRVERYEIEIKEVHLNSKDNK
ncbi:MAG: hypothetical protein IJ733_03075, partial [Lachnospiraceae bacterium]|nr:hypothetical protein [Lachnospiraceae bacterium]